MDAVTDEPVITAYKATAYLPIPDEMAMEYGLIPDTRPPAPAPRWRDRIRWRLSELRERAAVLAFRVVAGRDPVDP